MSKVQHIVVAGILPIDNTILCIKRSMDDTSGGYWEVPRGQLEFGESPEDALKREFLEETGLHIESRAYHEIFTYTYKKNTEDIHVLEIEFIVELQKGRSISSIVLDETSHSEWRLVSASELSKLEPMDKSRKASILKYLS